MHNTIIVGAGPVGSYLAEKVAQRGHKVLVLEKNTGAGEDVCCTGIVGNECVGLLAIDGDLIMKRANSARFRVSSGKSLRLWRDDEVACVIDRPAVDRLLASRARKAGARYTFGARVTDIQLGTHCVRVQADCHGENKSFEAQTAVIATGFGSSLPEKLGLGRIAAFTLGAQAEVEITGELDEIEVYFDRAIAPGGFAWLVPTSTGAGLAGLMARQRAKQGLSNLLSNLKARGKIRSTQVLPGYGAIPLRPLPRTYTNRLLAVGEAAGQVKPTTGGGIYYGLLCADMAADSLHRAFLAGDFSKASLAAYEKRWRAELGKELQVGYWAHRLYEKLSNRQIEYIHNVIDSNGIPQLVTESEDFSFDWHRGLILKVSKQLAVSVPSRAIKGFSRRRPPTSD